MRQRVLPGGVRCWLPWPGRAFYALSVETLTFLFTDIEGSTALLRRLGEGVYAQVLADHHSLIRSGLAAHSGEEVDTQGDAFFAVFSSPKACVAAVTQMQQAIEAHPWPAREHVRVRMGVHTGEAARTATGLVGLDIHRAARWRPSHPGARSCCRRQRRPWSAARSRPVWHSGS
jgi:class 3 adenylate cyclase